jgi:hypothetical protein
MHIRINAFNRHKSIPTFGLASRPIPASACFIDPRPKPTKHRTLTKPRVGSVMVYFRTMNRAVFLNTVLRLIFRTALNAVTRWNALIYGVLTQNTPARAVHDNRSFSGWRERFAAKQTLIFHLLILLWSATLAAFAQVAFDLGIFNPVIAPALGGGQQLLLDQTGDRPSREAQPVGGFVSCHLCPLPRRFMGGFGDLAGQLVRGAHVVGAVVALNRAQEQVDIQFRASGANLATGLGGAGDWGSEVCHWSSPFGRVVDFPSWVSVSAAYKIPRYPILVKHYFGIGL